MTTKKALVYIRSRKRKKNEFQFFMHQFTETAQRKGICGKNELQFKNVFKIKSLLIKLTFLFGLTKNRKSKAIIVTSSGGSLLKNSWPYCINYEIIPMLWDVWPYSWNTLYTSIRLLQCKIVFVTVRSMAEKISRDLGIKAYWIPEGIDINDYSRGQDLKERSIDLYELGRQNRDYHIIIEELHSLGYINGYYRNFYSKSGSLIKLAFPTAQDLLNQINDIKIIISFPQVDTHPQRAGGLETLTQRYWEAMLSRCLIIGRAPQELIDLIGYDHIINVDWNNPHEQLRYILDNISDYQHIVDKNYVTAKQFASWDLRIEMVKEYLKSVR